MNWCDFYCWSEKDTHLERITYSENLLTENIIPKLREFYFRYFLPEIVLQNHSK